MKSVQSHGSEAEVAEFFSDIANAYIGFYQGGGLLAQYFHERLAIVYRHLASELAGRSQPRILDLGCGPGMLLDYFLRRGQTHWEFQGLDIAEGMIASCQERFAQVETAQFQVGQLQNLDFPAHSFDAVLGMGVLGYLPEAEVGPAIAEATRVLKPGGVLILSFWNKRSLAYWKRSLKETAQQWLHRLRGKTYRPNVADSRRFNRQDIDRFLNQPNLSTLDCEYYGLGSRWMTLQQRLPWLQRIQWTWLYSAMVIKATKR